MPGLQFRSVCRFALVVILLFSFVCFSNAGTSRGINNLDQKTVFQNAYHQPAPADLAEKRSATDYHGRTLIFKSLILAPLALVVLILLLVLLIPIPVISSPIGRMFPSSTTFAPIQMARDVLIAEECVERISCELSRISRSYESTSWIPSALERFLTRGTLSERISRGLTKSIGTCSKFTCSPAKNIKRSLKMK